MPSKKQTEESKHENIWLDKQDVMQMIHVSSRTLQTWRTKGILPFSRVNGKIYYNKADLNGMLKKRIVINDKMSE